MLVHAYTYNGCLDKPVLCCTEVVTHIMDRQGQYSLHLEQYGKPSMDVFSEWVS